MKNLELIAAVQNQKKTASDFHACTGLRAMGEMPLHLLRKLAHGAITEQQAWALADKEEA